MSDLIPNKSDELIKPDPQIVTFTIKNRFENLQKTQLLNRWGVEEFEKLFGENIITSQIPLNNFTEELSSVYYEEVLEILSNKISDFVKTDLYDADYILKQFYLLKNLIKKYKYIINNIDIDFIINYLKDESKAYVINRLDDSCDPDSNKSNIIDIRELDIETAIKSYPIWSQAIYTHLVDIDYNKDSHYHLDHIDWNEYNGNNENERLSQSKLIPNYLPLLSIFYRISTMEYDRSLDFLITLFKPEIYTRNLVVKDLIKIFENIEEADWFFRKLEEWVDYEITCYHSVDVLIEKPRVGDMVFYNCLKVIIPIFQNELCFNILSNLKKQS